MDILPLLPLQPGIKGPYGKKREYMKKISCTLGPSERAEPGFCCGQVCFPLQRQHSSRRGSWSLSWLTGQGQGQGQDFDYKTIHTQSP